MQFTAISVWLFTGLAVLTAGVLAVLQYLRIRPHRVRVITTLFWQQAADQARARTLFERFRHPRTYLLLLAACLLLLLALAKPVLNARHMPHLMIALEAGLAMTAADHRFENALALLRAEVTSLPEGRVAVVIADPHPRLLKHFDDSLVVLEERLARVNAAADPVDRKLLLRAARSLLAGRENGELVLISAQPIPVTDADVRVLAAGETFSNAFLFSATFVPSVSDPTRGTFHCRAGFTGKEAGTRTVRVAREAQVLLEESVAFEPGERRGFSVADLAADGSILSVSVTGGDAVAGDNRLDFRLPDSRRILVVAQAGMALPAVLRSLLEGLPEVTLEAVDGVDLPVVRVGPAGSDAQVVIEPAGAGGELLPVGASEHPLLAGVVFEDALCRAPDSPLDGSADQQPLLLVNGAPAATLNSDATQLTVSATLFDEDASVVRRTGTLVFWSRTLHLLAGWREEPLTLSPEQARRSTDAGDTQLILKAGMSNFDIVPTAKAATPARSDAPRLPLWQLLLAAALVAMILDAILHIRGKIS